MSNRKHIEQVREWQRRNPEKQAQYQRDYRRTEQYRAKKNEAQRIWRGKRRETLPNADATQRADNPAVKPNPGDKTE